ncbi:hypothetical protein TevJSym_bb00210 [endosymbiont of Tevnia jerichonana (vent Tica)]|uniref:Uncharacterized protein n=1 Tax=endosymbiont of Tevnia jerichonana (vent Tica) TaxID=1049564 RepID=G2FIB3_9GAMM|nr:hypothetical protein TevJSym_bb00210 [endosymbiont of Tevnia jerichonana (vent Tica)]
MLTQLGNDGAFTNTGCTPHDRQQLAVFNQVSKQIEALRQLWS